MKYRTREKQHHLKLIFGLSSVKGTTRPFDIFRRKEEKPQDTRKIKYLEVKTKI